MSRIRTRSTRRANTHRIATRRRRQVKAGRRCGGTLTPNGENCDCTLCHQFNQYSYYNFEVEVLQREAEACLDTDAETIAPWRPHGREDSGGTNAVATRRHRKRIRRARRDAGLPEYAPAEADVKAAQAAGLYPYRVREDL